MNLRKISRRKFLKTASRTAASLFTLYPLSRVIRSYPLSYGPRTGIPNPYVTSDGKPILVCITGTDIKEMLTTGLETIGGLAKLINENQDVLIKPNLNSMDVYPAISSVEGIVGVIETVKKVSTGNIYVGDQSFDPTRLVYMSLNLESAVTNAGASLVNFSSTYPVRRDSWDIEKPDFSVYSTVYNSPIIINFACIKRHFLAKMTCALKNNVGTITGSGGSGSREYLHGLIGSEFLQEIAEIAGLINPELNIIDARSILTVSGPFSDWGVIKTGINKLIICGDMVATDAYCAQIMLENDLTFKISMIEPTLEQAVELGLGTADLSEVEIIEMETSVNNSNESSIPEKFELYPNYPNPFNSLTSIKYQVPSVSDVSLKVFDMLGREVKTLVKERKSPGVYSVIFNATGLTSGIYFYQLKSGFFVKTKKMIFEK